MLLIDPGAYSLLSRKEYTKNAWGSYIKYGHVARGVSVHKMSKFEDIEVIFHRVGI